MMTKEELEKQYKREEFRTRVEHEVSESRVMGRYHVCMFNILQAAEEALRNEGEMKVFVLYEVVDFPDETGGNVLGVYSSRAKIEALMEKAAHKPNNDFEPDNCIILEMELG